MQGCRALGKLTITAITRTDPVTSEADVLLRVSAHSRRSPAPGGRNRPLALPLPRQPFQLSQHLLNVLHLLGNAVSHGWRNRLFIVPEDKARALQRPQPLRKYARGDSIHLLPEHPKARRSVMAQRTQNVQSPGPRQQREQPADRAGRRRLRGSSRSHIVTRLLHGSYYVKSWQLFIVTKCNRLLSKQTGNRRLLI